MLQRNHDFSPIENASDPRLLALLAVMVAAKRIDPSKDTSRSVRGCLGKLPTELRSGLTGAIAIAESVDDPTLASMVDGIASGSLPITDFLALQLLREETLASAKLRGAVFTPAWLASRVTKNAIQSWHRLHRSSIAPKSVGDLSCGCGAFLYAISNLIRPVKPVRGADIHKGSLFYASLLGWGFSQEWVLKQQDVLRSRAGIADLFESQDTGPKEGGYDLLIGNPPYVRSSSLDPEYVKFLRKHYQTVSSGNFDLSVAFIEHALEKLSEGGVMSYVLTNKFMTSSYGRGVCSLLAKRFRVINLEDFQDYQVFPGYTTYTCVLTVGRKSPATRFSVTRFPQGVEENKDPGGGETATLPVRRLADHPWDFAGGLSHDTLRLLRDPRHPLISEVFKGIQQGIRTGANEVFILKLEDADRVEKKITFPFVGPNEIQRCALGDSRFRLLFPYRPTSLGQYRILSPTELEQEYPRAWRYLVAHKESLGERALEEGVPWYGFSRTQNLGLYLRRKLLIREMLPCALFAADFDGHAAFGAGYALDATAMDEAELRLWTAVLCTQTMEFVLRHNGTQLHSGWFRLMKHHLARTRLPLLRGSGRASAIRLASRIHSDASNTRTFQALDDLVAEAFGLGASHRRMIRDYLVDCHQRSLPSVRDSRRGKFSKEESKSTSRNALTFEPVRLERFSRLHRDRSDLRRLVTFQPNKELPIHRWYQYTQGFSARLVEQLIEELGLSANDVVLDPFAGCGTTSLVCRHREISSIGIELSPLMVWVARAKTTPWQPKEVRELVANVQLESISHFVEPPNIFRDYLGKAFSPKILNQVLGLAKQFSEDSFTESQKHFLLLGLLSILEPISQIRKHGSHYRFMMASENVGLQKLNTRIFDPGADIRPLLRDRLKQMAEDVGGMRPVNSSAKCEILLGDARALPLSNRSVTAAITSPPYLNRNNYIAQQKAELTILSLVTSEAEYRKLVRATFRSHTDSDLQGYKRSPFSQVQRIVDGLDLHEKNNQKIPHMITGYFDDLHQTVRELHRVMQPGGVAAFVVGNTRWGGVVVPVDHLLLMLAEKCGFEPERVLVTRLKGNSPQQMKKFGRIPVRESIVVFRKPG